MPRGNKGNWSEFYTLIKLLADGRIYAADSNLNRREDLFYAILTILRGQGSQNIEYRRNGSVVIQRATGEVLAEIPIARLQEFSGRLLDGITSQAGGGGAFEIENSQEIFEQLHTTTLSDNTQDKSDIRIVIHDPITQFEPTLGFSIKSYLGSKPTLFNASKKSNIVYKITPALSRDNVHHLNGMTSYTQRINWLNENNYELTFVKMLSRKFSSNLELIDSRLPEIIAEIVKNKFVNRINSLAELTADLSISNPCDFNLEANGNFYSYKIKRLLVDAALGLTANTIWTGTYDATGGFIIVKTDGDLVCFHIYNWNEFQNYLLNGTKVDAPDASPNRCDYGRILNCDEVEELEGNYIKLNFQIRFK